MEDDQLIAAIREVRDRVRARHPNGALGLDGVVAPDLSPLVHARDAAEAKVAAIGTVNPRPGGIANSIIQSFKKSISRALNWHVREQVEFNRAAMMCVQASLEALADCSRAIAALASHHQKLREEMRILLDEAQQLKDIRAHWAEWRVSFEDKRAASEIHMLRTIAELQGAFQHRVTMMDASFRELSKQQNAAYQSRLDQNTLDVQKRLWRDLENIRGEYEKLIHHELKLIRQKAVAGSLGDALGAPAEPGSPKPIALDWLRFAEVFRGSPERIKANQTRYAERFKAAEPHTNQPPGEILDCGCGRGEFLEAAKEAGVAVRGIDQSAECVAICKSKGLAAERADLFTYLDSLADMSLGGLYCSQVVEHIAPDRLPDLINLLFKKLNRGATIVIETPNPECLAIFATHFYIDPTHTRPVPAPLLRFYMEEAGFVNIEVERLEPAVESWPEIGELPEKFREKFFGGLDYAIFARKL